jgi:hypothetical protein
VTCDLTKLSGIGKTLAIGGGVLGAHLATSALLHKLMDKKEKRRDMAGKEITVRHENKRADDIANLAIPFSVAGLAAYMAHKRAKRYATYGP